MDSDPLNDNKNEPTQKEKSDILECGQDLIWSEKTHHYVDTTKLGADNRDLIIARLELTSQEIPVDSVLHSMGIEAVALQHEPDHRNKTDLGQSEAAVISVLVGYGSLTEGTGKDPKVFYIRGLEHEDGAETMSLLNT